MITVRATRLGWDGMNLRHIGDVFTISDARNEAGEVIAFSHKWMEIVPPGSGRHPTDDGPHAIL